MSKLIAVRIPDDVIQFIDGVKGKRSAVIVEALKAYFYCGAGQPAPRGRNADTRVTGADERRPAQRSGNGAAVPVLQKAKSGKKHVHPVQPVRDELAGRRDAPAKLPEPKPSGGKVGGCPHGKRNEAYCRYVGGGC